MSRFLNRGFKPLEPYEGKLSSTVLRGESREKSRRPTRQLYKGIICSPFRRIKDAIPGCLSPAGLVITFGYHSVVMGRNRLFYLERVALFSHGGAIHDTIASVERFTK